MANLLGEVWEAQGASESARPLGLGREPRPPRGRPRTARAGVAPKRKMGHLTVHGADAEAAIAAARAFREALARNRTGPVRIIDGSDALAPASPTPSSVSSPSSCYAGATVLYIRLAPSPAGLDAGRLATLLAVLGARPQLRLPLRPLARAEDRPLRRPPRVDGPLRPLPRGDEPHPRGPAPRPLARAVPDAGLAPLPPPLLRPPGRARQARPNLQGLDLRLPRHAEHAELLGLRGGVRPLAPLPRPRDGS